MDPEKITNIFATHFENTSSNNQYDPPFTELKNNTEKNKITISDDNKNPINKDITIEEITWAISDLKKNKRPGPDCIP